MNFQNELKKTLVRSLGNDFSDNYDYHLHGPENPEIWPAAWYEKQQWKMPFLSKRKYAKRVMKLPETKCEFLFDKLSEPSEKNLLLKLISYRQLGHKRVKLPDSKNYFKLIEELKSRVESIRGEALDIPFMFELHQTDLKEFGLPVNIYTRALAIYYEVIKDQYQHLDVGFKMNEGDYIIDAGACSGDTSLLFSHRVGNTGKVFAFEMIPENIEILNKNLALNETLAKNIEVIEKPVSENSNKEYYIFKHGPASRITETNEQEGGGAKVTSVSIDDFMEKNGVSKIDVIKMDIEGAELSALKGAKNTIQRYRPKLAICVYHKPMDFDEIPRYIDSLGMNYQYYLKHHGIQLGETVLYCQ